MSINPNIEVVSSAVAASRSSASPRSPFGPRNVSSFASAIGSNFTGTPFLVSALR